MKIIRYKWFTFLLAVIVAGTSCSHFEEMNFDPNKPTQVPTSALLTQAQANLVYNFNGELGQLGSQYVQHFAQLDYPDKSNYADDGISSFNSVYLGGLTDLNEIIWLNENEVTKDEVTQYGDNNNQIAVAKILIAWAYHNMTDIWGDLPYTEAVNSEIIAPVYDTQASIYDALVAELKAAQSLINNSPNASLKGDLIFGGDMEMWDAFAESLKIRIGMRLTEVDDAKAKSIVSACDFNKAFSNSSHYAEFQHLATEAEGNPLYIDNYISAGGDFFACADTYIDALNAVNDPRVGVFANPAVNSGLYVGHTYGVDQIGNANDVSMPGDMYAAQTAPTIIMTAAEILFCKAEAIERDYITGDAEAAYEAAITASMEYNGISSADITAYLAQTSVQYNSSNWEELIGTQKWFNFFCQGLQAWAEWRRLDYPMLSPGPDAAIATIPTRRAYTTDEYATNKENVEAAVARQFGSGDLFTKKLWWDK